MCVIIKLHFTITFKPTFWK